MDKTEFPQDWVLDSGPDVNYLIEAYQDTVNDLSTYFDQCRDNYKTRFAIWAGQSDTGKKTGNDAFPWKGASDLRVYLVDEAISTQKAILKTAYRKANIVAVPVEGNDIKRAKLTASFMKWLVQTKIPHVNREVALVADYMLEKGVAAVGVFWERKQCKVLEVLNLEQIGQQDPDLVAALADPANDEMLVDLLRQAYPGVKPNRARRMLKELRDTGETTIAVAGQVVNRPVIRAFALDEDLLIPPASTDIEHAPYLFRRHYMTPEQMREKVVNDGWDEAWVEYTIRTQRGKDGEMLAEEDKATLSRNFIDDTSNDYRDLVMVVYAYQRLSDDDNIPGIYETVFNPHVPASAEDGHKGYAKTGLLNYRHGEYPFVIFHREHLSRRLHDARGLPEPAKPYQMQVKVERDSRIDNASMATNPPIEYPIGRPPTAWGPGARIPTRRRGEYGYVERPPLPQASMEVEQTIIKSFRQMMGLPTDELDAPEARIKTNDMIETWLEGWQAVMQQVWCLYQQFGDERVFFRVIGSVQAQPQEFLKGGYDEKYDFYLSYDTISNDPEMMLAQLKQMVEFAQLIDRNGQVDYSEFLQAVFEAINPTLGERIIRPEKQAAMQEVMEENTAIAKMVAGVQENIPLGAANELRLQVLQQWAQSPLGQKYLTDENVRKAVENRVKQFQHQITQQNNRLVGIYGADINQTS